MKNFVQPGKTLSWTNATAAAVVSGDPVLVGNVLGVATGDIAIGATAALELEGVFTLPKVSTDNIAQGAVLAWDVSTGKLTTAAVVSGDVEQVAIAHSAAGVGATVINAKIGFIGSVKA